MSKQPSASGARAVAVDRDDLMRVLGEIDDALIVEILALKPTLDELERPSVWPAGDGDVLTKRGHPVTGVAADIVDILTPTKKNHRQRNSFLSAGYTKPTR